MKWIVRVLIFAAAFVLGTFAALFYWSLGSGLSDCTLPIRQTAAFKTPLSAKNLLGTWKGSWGYNDAACTLQIDQVDGNDFYGTLKKEGAVIRFEGTFDPKTREFYFEETEIVRLGAHMTGWSLGKNSGIISQDGHILVGDGHDKWGQYGWAASNY